MMLFPNASSLVAFACTAFSLLKIKDATSTDSTDPAPTATTLNGSYAGLYLPAHNQDLFLGMPFARAPRFSAPLPLNAAWTGTRPATAYGPSCPDGSTAVTATSARLLASEDCLSINIIRPRGTPPLARLLPVLLFLHGGGFIRGASSDPRFNLTFLVAESVAMGAPIVAASLNYRKAGWGFLAPSSSSSSSSRGVVGAAGEAAASSNVGLRDQRAGLRWVRENVGAFGGDAERVTVWGESAGAASVARLMQAAGGRGGSRHGDEGGDEGGDELLFRAGIMASGAMTGFGESNLADCQRVYDAVVEAVGCGGEGDSLECLRRAEFAELQKQWDKYSWGPVVDGDFLRENAVDQLRMGQFAKVPILHGAALDEGISFGFVGASANSDAELIAALHNVYNLSTTQAATFASLYPYSGALPPYSVDGSISFADDFSSMGLGYGHQIRRLWGMGGDIIMHAPRRLMSQSWAEHSVPAYAFVFDTNPTLFQYVDGVGIGYAMHGSELPYIFGRVAVDEPYGSDDPEAAVIPAHARVSTAMMRTWISFVNLLDPNHHGLDYLPHWPAYHDDRKVFYFNGTSNDTNDFRTEMDDYRNEALMYINENPESFKYR